jgi:universal stress protein A
MDKIKKILAPTDLSDLSQAGVRYAFDFARSTGAEVIVYHVACPDEFMRYELLHLHSPLLDSVLQRYRLQLDGFLEKHFPDILKSIELRKEIEIGIPEDNIVAKARDEGVDLIIISTHGRTGLSHVLVGSVTERVVRHAPCPVLSIRPESRITAPSAAAA